MTTATQVSIDVLNKDTAPEAAQETLEGVQKAYGFVPNLIGVMANAPALAKAYTAVSSAFGESSFSPAEQQVVLLSASYVNGCTYCMAAHTTIAGMQKVPVDVVEALRSGNEIADSKLEALRRFTVEMVESRGLPSEESVESFLGAGYEPSHILEVVLGVGLKTLSNYTNHVADTPLDAGFQKAAWSKG